MTYSTWEAEAKALRQDNERLRRAMQAAHTFCKAGSAPTAAKILQDALCGPLTGGKGASGGVSND